MRTTVHSFFALGRFSQFIVTSILFIYWLCHAACGNLVTWPTIEPRLWAVRAGSPNHWTAREFSTYFSMLLMSVTECGLAFYILRTSLCEWELAQCLAHNRHEREWFFLSSKIFFYVKVIWGRQWHPTPVLLPGKSHGWRSLVGCSPWGRTESDTTEWLHFHFSLSFIGEGNGNPLQRSCLENPRDKGACWAAVYGVAQSRTRLKRLSSSSNSILVIKFY